jgi:hypothetical protein
MEVGVLLEEGWMDVLISGEDPTHTLHFLYPGQEGAGYDLLFEDIESKEFWVGDLMGCCFGHWGLESGEAMAARHQMFLMIGGVYIESLRYSCDIQLSSYRSFF